MNGIYKNDGLSIQVLEDENIIKVYWKGKSVTRNPAEFITPILLEVLGFAQQHDREIELDFRELLYINSSTITPLIKILERIRTGDRRVKVLYDRSMRWQEISFLALKVFETEDRRVSIVGMG